jgi:phytoene dehydrogenase-like protein
MAPAGKSVIKVDLVSKYSYWKQLHGDKQKYRDEKNRGAGQVITELESHFSGIKSQIETIDVATPMTWERYMGGTHGFSNLPKRQPSLLGKLESSLPGLANFYFVGTWASAEWSLFGSALSARKLVAQLCKKDGRAFIP